MFRTEYMKSLKDSSEWVHFEITWITITSRYIWEMNWKIENKQGLAFEAP
jgi:hypothetical protein